MGMGMRMIFSPVGMVWEWELKFYTHGKPGFLALSAFVQAFPERSIYSSVRLLAIALIAILLY